MTEGEDAKLVQAALGGDGGAFDRLACRYRDAAFGTAFHHLGEFEAAQDAVQEALVTAYIELPMLRDPARFGPWLHRITVAAALTARRRRHPALPLDSPEVALHAGPESDPALALERSEETQQVRNALAALAERDRQAVLLHYMTGYSYEEVGGLLGASALAVKSRLHRARRRLREEMREMMEDTGRSQTATEIEFDEDLVRVVLHKIPDHRFAILDRWFVPVQLEFTSATVEAIGKVATELKADGYRWLAGPPHIPDGSPSLSMLKRMGFQVELEMHWYERSLKGRLPKIPPLDAGFQVRGLTEADAAATTRLLRATVSAGSPVRFEEEWIRQSLRSDHTLVHEATSGVYSGDRLTAFVLTFGSHEENPKYGRDTGLLWHAAYHPDVGSAQLVKHLIARSLMQLKRAGFKQVVKDQLQPRWERDRELITVLEELGFRYVRSQWNLKLDLDAWKNGSVQGEGAKPTEAQSPPAAVPPRQMRPLRYAASECPVPPAYSEALKIEVSRILGTSPIVAPGAIYIASGEYTLREPVVPLLGLACDGASSGFKLPLEPGSHSFDAPVEIREVTPGTERTLYLNMIGGHPKVIRRLRIELEGWEKG